MTSRVLFILSSLLNIGLGALIYRSAEILPVCDGSLREGAKAQILVGANVGGESVSVGFPAEHPLIVYFFSPQCRWCERNYDSISALARETTGAYRFVAISLDESGIVDWLTVRNPEFEVWRRLDFRSAVAYPARQTPTTAVISKLGKVEKLWHGAYRGQTLKEIEQYFGKVLPAANE